MADNVRVAVVNESVHPVSNLLFGQFLERPSWHGETGPEAAMLPDSGSIDQRVEALLRKMDILLVRFPGGTDVDYLDWRDMVSSAHNVDERRPISRGHSGQAITNAFGYDEFFRLAADLNWQTILVINLRDGMLTSKTPDKAAEHAAALLAYCTGTQATVPESLSNWPALRATNGHPDPYQVDYVQIGNESWFWTQLMQDKHGEDWITEWADITETFIAALRRVQPDIKLIVDAHPLEVTAELERRQAGINLYALHRYYPMSIERLIDTNGEDVLIESVTPQQVWDTLVHSTETNEDGLAQWHDRAIDHSRRLDYKLAFTEWNLNAWWSLPRRDELWPGYGACGLGAAIMLNAMIREGDVFALATQSMLIGQSWGITGIRVDPTQEQAPFIMPTAEVVTLYNHHHGDRRLPVYYKAQPPLWQASIHFRADQLRKDAAVVDIVATRSRDNIFIHAINTDFQKPYKLTAQLKEFQTPPTRAIFHCLHFHTQAEQTATNVWANLRVEEASVDNTSVSVTLPPRSAGVIVVDLADER